MSPLEILAEQNFNSLLIRRIDGLCYLVVFKDGKGFTVLGNNGKPMIFKNAWEWKDWLKNKFNIIDKIDVQELKN